MADPSCLGLGAGADSGGFEPSRAARNRGHA